MRASAFFVTLAVLCWSAPALAQQKESAGRDVSGLVADASTGAPLEGAAITIEGTGIRALTNSDGRFVIRGIPPGEHTWLIQRLGYATWEQPMTVAHLDQLRIGLLARPIALEAITATVSRLEQRRRLAGLSVHTVGPEALRSSTAVIAGMLTRSRMPWMPVSCPDGPSTARIRRDASVPNETTLLDRFVPPAMETRLCIRWRGRVEEPVIYLDERPIPYAALAAYGADEIHAIDYIGGGGRAQVRLYTIYFLESGKPLRPLGF